MYEPADISHWHATLPTDALRRDALKGGERADVVIVGAGFTGLWTAYYLMQQAPDLSIIVLDANFVGFGASGRNGGWCSPDLAGVDRWLEDDHTHASALALQHQMFDAVDEVGRICQRENIDCDYAKDGMISVATTQGQEKKLHADFKRYADHGFDDKFQWVSQHDLGQYINLNGGRAGVLSSHCAALQPAKLVTGLAGVLERKGVRIFEQSRAVEIKAGGVTTDQGSVSAPKVVIATEAYSAKIPPLRRRLAPVHSQLIVTQPLGESVWQEIGLRDRLLFGDGRALVTYGQRTADDRIAFGYRASYHFGSGIQETFDAGDPSFKGIRDILVSFFPVLDKVRIDRCWGGALGVTRNMAAFVHYNRESGLAWAGGYTGNGVAASNLAGRTLADLLQEQETERVTTPWVKNSGDPLTDFPHWEPEPIRWLGVQGVRTMLGLSDWLGSFGGPAKSGS